MTNKEKMILAFFLQPENEKNEYTTKEVAEYTTGDVNKKSVWATSTLSNMATAGILDATSTRPVLYSLNTNYVF